MRKRTWLIFLLAGCLNTAAAQSSNTEADLKAVFIYNFTRYIEWDSSSVGQSFVIGIIGSSPVKTSLLQIANSSTVLGKKILVQTYDRPEEIQDCQMLFIPSKSPFSLGSILNHAGGRILTISEEEGFARRGTAFNFIIAKDKLKFEINIKELAVRNIKVSSQLLKLAVIIQ